jgi:hypothetical protein
MKVAKAAILRPKNRDLAIANDLASSTLENSGEFCF